MVWFLCHFHILVFVADRSDWIEFSDLAKAIELIFNMSKATYTCYTKFGFRAT